MAMLNARTVTNITETHRSLLRYCRSLTGSRWEAEDLAQEACVRAMDVIQGARPHLNPEAYLFRTAKNAWIDQLRRRQRFPEIAMVEDVAETTNVTLNIEIEEALENLLSRLSPIQRTVFLLREVFGYSTSQTAERLQTTEGAVKAALRRGRTALSDIDDHGDATSKDGNNEDLKQIVRSYAQALRDGDAKLIVQLMHNDALDPSAAVGIVLHRAAAQNRRTSSADNASVRMAA